MRGERVIGGERIEGCTGPATESRQLKTTGCASFFTGTMIVFPAVTMGDP